MSKGKEAKAWESAGVVSLARERAKGPRAKPQALLGGQAALSAHAAPAIQKRSTHEHMAHAGNQSKTGRRG
jgi:hypothetical protein